MLLLGISCETRELNVRNSVRKVITIYSANCVDKQAHGDCSHVEMRLCLIYRRTSLYLHKLCARMDRQVLYSSAIHTILSPFSPSVISARNVMIDVKWIPYINWILLRTISDGSCVVGRWFGDKAENRLRGISGWRSQTASRQVVTERPNV